jgi:peptidoglycan-N-acetylglucosamine deacetylase
MLTETIRALRAGRHGIAYAAPRRYFRREIALTFDDGPSSEWTPQILDLLREHGARATFFLLGCSIAGREAILTRAVDDGHELANHAFSHTDPALLSDEELRAELTRTAALVEAVVGTRPRHFRPPYADTDFRVADVARSAGFDPDAIADQILAEARRGSIVCLHDALPPDGAGTPSRQPTVDALTRVVPELARRRYRLVTVGELLAWNRR